MPVIRYDLRLLATLSPNRKTKGVLIGEHGHQFAGSVPFKAASVHSPSPEKSLSAIRAQRLQIRMQKGQLQIDKALQIPDIPSFSTLSCYSRHITTCILCDSPQFLI